MHDADRWRLAFDVGPVRGQPAGVGRYASSVAREAADLLPERVTLIGARPDAEPLDRIRAERQGFRGGNYHAWIQLHADGQARRARADLVHYTNAAAPAFARVPYVVTVHDLSVVRMPGTHPIARRLTVPVMLWAVARAEAIVVPSAFTRAELARIGVPERKVSVIPHAPAPAPERASERAESDESGALLERLGLVAGEYIVTIGTLEPRKNLLRLVAAFERIGVDHPRLKLVLAGAPGWRYGPVLRRMEHSRFRDRIVLPGYLSPADLATLTRECGVSAYVSVYEGFGMPIIDAMALNAAVVASQRTAMPEAAGGAAVLVDPYDIGSIARGLVRALRERERLRDAGTRRVAHRSWTEVAAEHVELYRWAIARR